MVRVLVVVALLVGSWPVLSHAQDTLYVTDKLLLGLYPKPQAGGESLTTLVSGTPLQALEQGKYYTRVRTPDGTEGWVKSAYLVQDKPPRLLLDQLRATNEALTKQLQQTRDTLASQKQSAAQTDAQLQQLQHDHDTRNARLERLETENHELRQRIDTRQHSVPLAWLLGAAVGCLILGLWGGHAWVDYRIRRRHGGFRIY